VKMAADRGIKPWLSERLVFVFGCWLGGITRGEAEWLRLEKVLNHPYASTRPKDLPPPVRETEKTRGEQEKERISKQSEKRLKKDWGGSHPEEVIFGAGEAGDRIATNCYP